MKTASIPWDGTQITRPGIYSGLPLSLYHSPFICAGDWPIPQGHDLGDVKTFHPSISSSGLRAIYGQDKSPKHFYAKWTGNPNYRPDPLDEEMKRHFVLGRATHHLFLGERNFAKLFKIQPHEYPDDKGELKPWHNGAKFCKAWNRQCMAEGRSWLSRKEVEQIRQMAHSVSNHPLVQAGALNGQIERSIFWRDEETGIWLKSRPDSIPSDSADFVDLKNIYDIFAVRKAIRQHAYYRQVALTRDACEQVLKVKWESFTLIFVEAKDPWHTQDVRCYEKDIKLGRDENRAAIRIFAKCMETGEWPGPGDNNIGNERVGLSDEAREAAKKRLKYETGLEPSEDY